MGLGQGTRSDHLNAMSNNTDLPWAFDICEASRPRLPDAGPGGNALHVPDLGAIADDFDLFLLDAFGVLNIGETAIPGAVERIAALRGAGKRVMVVTNAAGYPKRHLMRRYGGLGFEFAPADVVSSREALIAGLSGRKARRWGLMANPDFGLEDLEAFDLTHLLDDPAPYEAAEGFILMGAGIWTEPRQKMLEQALKHRPRPVLVGNPDIVAPRETGVSREPGYYAHLLAENAGADCEFFGKPFRNIYDLALARLPEPVARARTLMVGDTLHTDILGGQAAGIKTALTIGDGFLKGVDVGRAIAVSGLRPDFILPRI